MNSMQFVHGKSAGWLASLSRISHPFISSLITSRSCRFWSWVENWNETRRYGNDARTGLSSAFVSKPKGFYTARLKLPVRFFLETVGWQVFDSNQLGPSGGLGGASTAIAAWGSLSNATEKCTVAIAA
ncbi:hypothetical protein R6Q59_035691 [Mikania micrantha]